jgi:hypothetical protein
MSGAAREQDDQDDRAGVSSRFDRPSHVGSFRPVCTFSGVSRASLVKNIGPRMAAHLVATPLDPLRDINGLKRIDFVMKNGLVYRRP